MRKTLNTESFLQPFGPGLGTGTLPLNILESGNSLWSNDRLVQRKLSYKFVVELVTEGNLTLVQEKNRHLIGPGEIFFLRENVPHSYSVGPAKYVHKRFTRIAGPLLEPLLRSTGLYGLDHLVLANVAPIKAIFRTIHKEAGLRLPGFENRLSLLAYELLLNLRNEKEHSSQMSPLTQALEFIHENLGRKILLRDVAQQVGLSETHLKRLFKTKLNLSLGRHIVALRMDWAKHLLKQKQYSIKQVAEKTGFLDSLYFSAQFRKKEHMTPTQFRALHCL